jgi:hypothetical protein
VADALAIFGRTANDITPSTPLPMFLSMLVTHDSELRGVTSEI